jgi:hypothetical protein
MVVFLLTSKYYRKSKFKPNNKIIENMPTKAIATHSAHWQFEALTVGRIMMQRTGTSQPASSHNSGYQRHHDAGAVEAPYICTVTVTHRDGR